MNRETSRHDERTRLATLILPLLDDYAATFDGDDNRPNFQYSAMGEAVRTVRVVLEYYAERQQQEAAE